MNPESLNQKMHPVKPNFISNKAMKHANCYISLSALGSLFQHVDI